MRWWPQSLFGRLILVLGGGMLVAQLLSAAFNLVERDQLLTTASGRQQAQRIADVVNLLDVLGPAERERVVAVLNVSPLVVSLHDGPAAVLAGRDEAANAQPRARMFAALLSASLGNDRALRIEPGHPTAPAATQGMGPGWHKGIGGAFGGKFGLGGSPGMNGSNSAVGPNLQVEVQLRDGRWARFNTQLPKTPDNWPWRLAFTLLMLLLAVLTLSFVAVRWVTRPLQLLAAAAEGLGQDIDRPPMSEDGPSEVRRAAQAFNAMQKRLSHFIHDRTRILAAMSHDLKTPITRLRLRAELMEDDELRERFEKDLKELESMVTNTLDFMRGLGGNDKPQPVDINALLESLQADNREMGHAMHIKGRADQPLTAVAPLLKRCLANLIENAMIYGASATVLVKDTPQCLRLRILDEGPGIPLAELEQVFEPFYRLEGSRSRETGGTGLGLSIARNIAQMHGGGIELHNRAQGGLEVLLTLPRKAAVSG